MRFIVVFGTEAAFTIDVKSYRHGIRYISNQYPYSKNVRLIELKDEKKVKK